MHNSLTMQKIGQHAWPVQALLLCSVLVCSQVQTASASGNSVTASTPRALQNHRMVDYSAHNDNFEVSSDSMLHDTDDEQLLVKWATGTPTIQIREGYTGTESVADAILSRKLRQDEEEAPAGVPAEIPAEGPKSEDEAPETSKNKAPAPEEAADVAVSPTSTPSDPLDLRQDDVTGSSDDSPTDSGQPSAQGPSSDEDEDDEDEESKNFGFEFDSGMVTYILVFAGIALCMCPFAAWQCLSKPKKKSGQFVQPDVEVISI